MRNYILLFFLLSLVSPLTITAQKDSTSNSFKKNSLPDIEKIYLHTDRDYYTMNESLWYKAYVVYAYNNVLFDNSKILYVELVSPESKIIARNITQLNIGLGHGDFMLSDSIGFKPGTYQLRAYTNWSRNFDDDYVFKKEIQIVAPNDNSLQKIAENTSSATDKKKTIQTEENQTLIHVDFFPEGGSLIEDVNSYIAFKATDNYGNPITIEGTIIDQNQNQIAVMKSLHDGMGKFRITPQKNQEYKAEIITSDNQKLTISLPKAIKTGYVLNLEKIKNKNIMSIKTNDETLKEHPNTNLTMICSSRGINYYESSQILEQTSFSFILPEEQLPEGITKITFYDDNLIPQTERLIYIQKNNNTDISLTTDKIQYTPKEKVTLNFSAKDKQGNPLIASYSIAVTDEGNIQNNNNDSNICSYFLMESDIRGQINNPGYYFDSSNLERLFHLDLLLLTQGWRDFLWKKIPSIASPPAYKLEKEITISGKIKKLLSEAPKVNNSVKMVILDNSNSIILDDTTDQNGKFEFKNLEFYGKVKLLLNSQNEKGKNSGMFVLDSIYNQPPITNFKNFTNNEFQKNNINLFRDNIHNKNIIFKIPEENQLQDVVIKVKKKDKDTEPSLYGFADFKYIPEENSPHFSNIFQYLQYAIPNVTVTGNSVQFSRYSGPPFISVDGIETEMELLSSISTDDIGKIEVFKGPSAIIFGPKGSNGAIVIYTKRGGGISNNSKDFHSICKEITGYQNTRYFYSPDYSSNKSPMDGQPDIRNTLYWNPYLQTNEKGNSQIIYYNTDASTNIKVVIEGITNNGIPIIRKTEYTVKKEQNK